MGKNIWKKFSSWLALFSLLFNIIYPVIFAVPVHAEEATPSASVEPIVSPSPSASDVNLTSQPTASPTVSPIPESTASAQPVEASQPNPTPAPISDWENITDQGVTTSDNLVLDHLYTAPQNNKVTVKFNKLSNPGKLTIKEVTLTDEQVRETGALDKTAYDISSTMPNGTFEYTLTLPTPTTQNVEVKASEDGQTFFTVGGVTAQADRLTITGLNHFTVFVIASPSGGVDASDIGTITWNGTANIYASDNNYATAFPDDNQITHYLKATNFDMSSVPSTANIQGILVQIKHKADTANSIRDYSIRIIKGGVLGSTEKADTATFWPISDTYASYGSSNDLWGESWTAAQIKSADFGVAVSAIKDSTAGNTITADVDHIKVTVYYNTPPVASDQSVSSNEDTSKTITLGATDVDSSDVLTYSQVLGPSHGSLGSISGNQVTYTPSSNYNGSDSFTFKANDGTVDSNTATVNITVDPVNDPPAFDAVTDQSVYYQIAPRDIIITNVSSGPSDESSQIVTLSATSSNTSLSPNPSISAVSGGSATLTYSINSNTTGSATITVTADDGQSSNNTFSRTFTINVAADTTPPIITYIDRTVPNGAGWNNTDVTVNWSCSDAQSGVASAAVSQTISAEGAGQSATGTCTDLAGNSASDTQTGVNIDKTAPVIDTPSNVTVEATSGLGATVDYVSPGVTDNIDAPAIASCSPVSGSTFPLGDTTVVCDKTDTAGNIADTQYFTVTVQDTTAPEITILGDDPQTVEINSAYTDPGVIAADLIDGSVPANPDIVVDTSTVGDYTITYTASDSAGNISTKTRTVHVQDSIAEAFNTISTNLSAANIANNLNLVNTNNITSFSGLYFEKSVSGVPLGKLTFTNPLDLSDVATQTFLQNLGSKLDQANGRIALDARTSSVFQAVGASLEMYDIASAVSSNNLVVRDDTGTIVDPSSVVSGFSYDPGTHKVTFTTAHFTQFDIDTIAPVTSDNSDSNWHGNNQTITLTCTDVLSGCAHTYYTTNGTDPTTSSTEGTSVLVSSEGVNTIKYFSVDQAGNSESIKTAAVKIDKSAPTAPGTPLPFPSANPSNQNVLSWSWAAATDSLSGVGNYLWSLVSGSTEVLTGSVASPTVSTSTDITSFTDGVFTFKVKAGDSVDNFTDWVLSSPLTVDRIAPESATLTINSGASYTNNSTVNLAISATDSGSGVSEMRFSNGGSYSSWEPYAASKSWDLSAGEGTKHVYVEFKDNAGNFNSSNLASAQIIYDITSPALNTVQISSSNSNSALAKVGDVITLAFNSTEALQSTPTVTIAGHAATVTGSNTSWSATYTMVSGDSEGIVPFTINFKDLANNNGAQVSGTTDTSAVTFDKTAPDAPAASPLQGSYTGSQSVTISSTGSSQIKYSTSGSVSSCTTGTLYSGPISLSSSTTLFVLACDNAGNSTSGTFAYTIGSSNLQPPSESAGQVTTSSTLTLNNNASLDLSNGTQGTPGTYTGGDLTGQDLTNPFSLGDQSITVGKEVKITSSGDIALTNSDLSNVLVTIPNNTTVLAPSGWDGTILPPKTGSSSGSAPSGFSVGSTVIEIGSTAGALLFDQPVIITLTGVTGEVGYKPAGSSTWTQITTACSGTYANPGKPTFPGECYISDGVNTKIYTYHFTNFGSLTAVSSTTTSSSTSSGSSGGGSSSAPACNDAAAGGAPTLLSAIVSGVNQVTLTWSKASDPVTNYVVVYGLSSGNPVFGNPNVGGKDTTSYVVSGLSGGTTYYFKVRAGNGCNAGPYSNEIAVTPGGQALAVPASGFIQGVLGTTTESANEEQATSKEEVKGATATTIPQPTSPAKSASIFSNLSFNTKVVLLLIALLLGGFGIFRLVVKK